MSNCQMISSTAWKRSRSLFALLTILVGLLILSCGIITGGSPSTRSSSSGIQGIEVARVPVGPKIASIALPQGAEIVFPAGSLSDSSTFVAYQLKGNPNGIPIGVPAAEGFEFKFSNNIKPVSLVEILLPVKMNNKEDPSLFTIYRSDDGFNWVDIGGIVEGAKIKAWTDHFSYFWVVKNLAPHRPIEFVNQGWFDARIFVATYLPDPSYAVGAPPQAAAISVAPSTLPALNPGRYLSLPVGGYTFCYDWYNPPPRMFHAYTAQVGVFDYSPKYIEGAVWVVITPGREAKIFDGPCGSTPPPQTSPGVRQSPPSTFVVKTPTLSGMVFTPTSTQIILTLTRTRTPVVTSQYATRTPTKTLVNYLPYYNAWIKRIEDLRNEFIQKNCTPPYSGCAIDIGDVGTAARNGLYTHYTVNLHSSYITFAKSLEDQLLAALRPCLQEMVDNRFKGVDLDVRRGVQSQCIRNSVGVIWDREYRRIFETSCRANCGEQGKIGVIEGSPWYCACK